MVNQQLIEYIKKQLQNGVSKESIISNLIAKGWQSTDIESAFQMLTPNQPLTTPVTTMQNIKPTTKPFPVVAVIICLILLAFGGGTIFFLSSRTSNKPSSQINTIPSIQKSLPTLQPTKNIEETILYSSPEQGYGFRYLKSWKITKQGTATSLTDPQAKSDSTTQLFGNVIVSSIPYSGNVSTAPGVTIVSAPVAQPHETQVKDLALQMATDEKITLIKEGSLNGYETITSANGGFTYNLVLQGSKNILMIQFPNKKNQADLNQGEKIIIDSIVEQ